MIFAAITDIAGKLRGKAFPVTDLDYRLKRGVGWTPTNVQITCFDLIGQSPYGALGDILIIPDPSTEVRVDYEDGLPPEHFMLGHVRELDGSPWECCTRAILESALARLDAVAGLHPVVAFEHEFHIKGGARPLGDAYSFDGYRANARLLSALMAALRQAGLSPETAMKEYGADQYEVTIRPLPALQAADASTVVRELTRVTAMRLGEAASFSPIRSPNSVGNGVHVHMSLRDQHGRPATYDPRHTGQLSETAGAFVAGILKYLDSILAITAPSVISYHRLTPHRWSAAFNNLGLRDREAAVRICGITPRDEVPAEEQFNFEFRAADPAASAHLALTAIVHAGAQGIEEQLQVPEPTQEDLSQLEPEVLAARGLARLPQSLPEALERFAANSVVTGWFRGQFPEVYRMHKTAEIGYVETLEEEERFAAYEAVY